MLTIAKQEEENNKEDETEHTHLDEIEASLNSVSGLTPPQTMKVKGYIRGLSVLVLIESGSTHSFISKQVINKFGMKISGDDMISVQLGIGMWEKSQGTCQGVILNLP